MGRGGRRESLCLGAQGFDMDERQETFDPFFPAIYNKVIIFQVYSIMCSLIFLVHTARTLKMNA